jgi:hypothetical protein
MSSLFLFEAVEFQTLTFEPSPFEYTNATSMTPTTCVEEFSALELIYAWGAVPGPDLRDPRSVFKRRPLAVRGTRVYRNARTIGRAAACRPHATACIDDAKPRESVGAITVWSANAPPTPLGA